MHFKPVLLQKGFTLIELLVVIGIIAILTAAVAIAVNPGRQFAQARDSQRRSDIQALLDAVIQYSADNNGTIPSVITTTPTNVGTGTGLVDLSAALVPTYITVLPKDPTNGTDADTNYVIFRQGTRVIASASGEVTPNITMSR